MRELRSVSIFANRHLSATAHGGADVNRHLLVQLAGRDHCESLALALALSLPDDAATCPVPLIGEIRRARRDLDSTEIV